VEEDGNVAVPYQIPQTIYIGDNGRLIYPLDTFFYNQDDQIFSLEDIPRHDDITVSNVELSKGQLFIDFQAWRTGIVKLPSITIAGRRIDGIEVVVASLVEGQNASTMLSAAVTPVSAPGTLWLITGTVSTIIIVTALFFFFMLRGKLFFVHLRRNTRKKRAIRLARKAIRKIRNQLEKKNVAESSALSHLSTEFRLFLDVYCGIDCRSLVPAEFLNLEFPLCLMPAERYSPAYFADFFTRCDTLRFSGKNISDEAVANIISEVENFVCATAATIKK
jgi:hypothetical protein